MRKLLDKALWETELSIRTHESRCDSIRKNELKSWLPWKRWIAWLELERESLLLSYLYRHKVSIMNLIDKYEIDPIS